MTMLPSIRALLLPAVLAALPLGGCTALLPDADRLDVQQGNVLSEADIGRLAQGQTRAQVRELIGEPILAAPFHADRWDYVYYKTEAGSFGDTPTQRLTLYFGTGGLERIVDRYEPPADPLPEAVDGPLPEPQRPATSAPGESDPSPSPSPVPSPG